MARAKKSIYIMEKEGRSHLTKAEIIKRKEEEPKAELKNVFIPDFLPAKLNNEFMWLVEELNDIGIIGTVDMDAVARYVMTNYQYETVAKQISTEINRGALKENETFFKLINAQDKLLAKVRQQANDIGLTISSRGKITKPENAEADQQASPEDQLFGGDL